MGAQRGVSWLLLPWGACKLGTVVRPPPKECLCPNFGQKTQTVGHRALREEGLELAPRFILAFGVQERDSSSGGSTEASGALQRAETHLACWVDQGANGRPLWTQTNDLSYGQNRAVLVSLRFFCLVSFSKFELSVFREEEPAYRWGLLWGHY